MKKGTIIIILFTVFYNCALAQIEIMEKFDLGEYNVGFKYKKVIDYSRAYGNSYRSIQLFIWYPAEENSITPFQYGDYFLLNLPQAQSLDLDTPNKIATIDSLIQKEVERLNNQSKTGINLTKYKNLQTVSRRDIPPSQKSFPLLLFAPGGNTSGHLNSVICEYLASHGYIVVSFPSLGNADTLRWPFDQTGLNLHIDDMAFAINHLKQTMNQLNIDKTGLISWSVGGVSQAIYCMKNPNIDLFISLDSGIGRVYGIEMLKESPYFDFMKFNIPYLHMTGKQPEMYQVERSSEFYDSIASAVKYSLVIEPFAHQHFAALLGIIPALSSEKEDETIVKSYVDMCRLSLVFTNAYLKDEINSKKKWLDLIKDN